MNQEYTAGTRSDAAMAKGLKYRSFGAKTRPLERLNSTPTGFADENECKFLRPSDLMEEEFAEANRLVFAAACCLAILLAIAKHLIS